jgi:hypothetical protein
VNAPSQSIANHHNEVPAKTILNGVNAIGIRNQLKIEQSIPKLVGRHIMHPNKLPKCSLIPSAHSLSRSKILKGPDPNAITLHAPYATIE